MNTTRSWNLKAASQKYPSSSSLMFWSDLLALGNEETLKIYWVTRCEKTPAWPRKTAGIMLGTAFFYGCSFPF